MIKYSRRGLLGEICEAANPRSHANFGLKLLFGIQFGLYGGAIGANLHEN